MKTRRATARPSIPEAHRALWVPFDGTGELHHLTSNLPEIEASGRLEPRDPAPYHWAGMQAIFLGNPDDPLYEPTLPYLIEHVASRARPVHRLVLRTRRPLYRSIDPKRTFMVACLEPIPVSEVIRIEPVSVVRP